MTTHNLTENGGTFVASAPDVTGIDVGTCPHDADRLAWTVMEDYAALVRDRTPIRAGCLPLAAWAGTDTVAARIAGLPSRVSAVFVVGMGPSESASVQLKVASLGGPVVVSEVDVVAAALGAAAISTLRRRGVAPRRGHIVVINPEVAPRLRPLLRTAGAGTLTTWNQRDAEDYPLHTAMAHQDLLIDLAGTAPDTAAPGRTLRLPRERFDYGALVLPGLLGALGGGKGVSLTIDVLAACARALAAITPPDRIVPALTEALLVPSLEAEVVRARGEHPWPHRPHRQLETAPQPMAQHQYSEGESS